MSRIEGIDASQAATFLAERFGAGVHDLALIPQGEWSKTFRFDRDGAGYVIRFSVLDEDFAKDRIAMRWSSPRLPIPRIVEMGEALGGYYAISERAPGSYLDHVDGAQLRALLPALFGALDAMREADVSSFTGAGGWDAGGNAPHASWRESLLRVSHDRPGARTGGWRASLAASETGAGPFDEGYAALASLVDACPEARHLIHSDLLHFNVLVTGSKIDAVVDWGCSLYGDFLYDVAWFLFWWPWYPAWSGIDFRAEIGRHYERIGLHVPDMDARLRCYQLHIGLDGMAYCAFKGNWKDVAEISARILRIARDAGPVRSATWSP